MKLAIIVGFFFFFFYLGINRVAYYSDTIGATFLPVAIIRGEGFDLGKIYPRLIKVLSIHDKKLPYFIIHRNDHYLSIFPVFSSVLALPIYIIPVIIKNITTNNINQHFYTIIFLGKVSASLFSAISVFFVFLSLIQLLNTKKALILTVLYAFGTSTLSISSQTLWQHATSQMLLSIAIYCFIKGKKRKQMLALTGLFLGFATLSRFIDISIALAFFVYLLFFERKSIVRFIIFSLPAFIFFIWYQLTYAGDILFTGYEGIGTGAAFNNQITSGILGLLLAPNKGLFIYSPIFLLSVWGTVIGIKQKDRLIEFFSIVVLLFILLLARWSVWHGGWAFGPRMLSDITPFLIILIVPVIKINKIWQNYLFKLFFCLLTIISVCIHFLGATVSDLSWYHIHNIFLSPEKIKQAAYLLSWSLKDSELHYYYLRSGGFFGIIMIFTQELFHILLTIIVGFFLLIFFAIFFFYVKRKSSLLIPSVRKRLW